MRLKLMTTFLIVFGISLGVVHAKEEAYLELADAEWGELDAPLEVRNGANHSAYYGWLNDEADIDVFHYAFDEPANNFNINLSVPRCGDHFEGFYPSVAIIGAGLETHEDVDLPFDLPESAGALVFTEPAVEGIRRVSRNQPYNFYISGTHSINLEAGDYWIAVWDADTSAGAYLLRTTHTHPDFTDFTNADWETMEAAYDAINNGGWVTPECGMAGL